MTINLTYRAEQERIEERMKYLEDKRERIIKAGGPGAVNAETSYLDADNIHGSGNRMDAETLCRLLAEVNQELIECQKQYRTICRYLKAVEETVQLMQTSKDKVRYLRYYCGYNLPKIADIIGLSYQRVKEISAELSHERDE